MVEPRRKILSINGLNLSTYEWGDPERPALLLLHGLTSHGRVWDEWAERWSSDYHVVAYDQRGHGNSEHASPGGFDSYNVRALAADISGVADAFGFSTFSILGHSIGGRPIIVYAKIAPERLERAVIVDIGPKMDRAGGRKVRNNVKSSVDTEAVSDAAAAEVEAPASVDRDPSLLEIIGPKSLVEIDYLWESIRELTCPTLVVHGETSNILSQRVAERMADELPDGELVVISGAGHGVPTENPEEFGRRVSDFLLGRAAKVPSVPAEQGGTPDLS